MAKKPVFVEQDNFLNPLFGVEVGFGAAPTVGDLDGDGDKDILVGDGWSDLKYFRNQGGSFTEIKEGKNPFEGVELESYAVPKIFDWDGDGDEDVLVGNYKGRIEYLRNQGDSFTELAGDENPFNGVEVGNSYEYYYHGDYHVTYYNGDAVPTLFDVDGDGDEDLLVGDYYGRINYFRNDQNNLTEVTGSENPFDVVDVGENAAPTVLDVDGDGDEDILVGNKAGEIRYFHLKKDSWTEVTGSKNPFNGVNVGGYAKPAGFDREGDGDEDVLVGNSAGEIKYFQNLTIEVNESPIAVDDSVGIAKNKPTTIDVLENDVEPEKEAISLIEFEKNTERGGTIKRDNNGTPEDLTDDKLIYTPPVDFSLNETDSFTYTIADTNNQKTTATVNVLAIPIFGEQNNSFNPFFGVDVGDNAIPTIGDLDGDGDEDVLVGNGGGELKYFRNEGDSFTELIGSENPFDGVNVIVKKSYYGYYYYGNAIPAIGDLDGDGDEDVLVGNGEGEILYFRNEGASFIEVTASEHPFDELYMDWNSVPAIGDLDGDLDEDVLISNSEGEILYFRNEGASFIEVTGSDNPFEGVDVDNTYYDEDLSPIIGDLDEDGDEDVLVGNTEGEILYFRNDGASFIELTGNENPFAQIRLEFLEIPTLGDINGDGDEDLVIGQNYGEIKYFENLNIDVNDAPIAMDDSVGVGKNKPITINVLKNDFEPEKEAIALVEFEGNTGLGGKVERDENETPEDLTDDQLIYTPPAEFSVNETDSFTYTIADPNNQTATATVNILAIPIFQEQNNSLNPFLGVNVEWNATPTAGDLDGDGSEDVLLVNGYGEINYFENNGDNFTQVKDSKNPFDGVNLNDGNLVSAIGDVDEDGDEDLLVGQYGKIRYFRNYGDSWAEPIGNSNPFLEVNMEQNAAPAIGDLDGDGDEDVLVGNEQGKIEYFRNEKGSFTQLLGSDNPFDGVNVGGSSYDKQVSPAIIDLDSDGDEDVLVGNSDGEIFYFRNEKGSFTQLPGSENPFDKVNVGGKATLTEIDLNKDGDPDVLVGNGEGKIKYFENLSIDINDPAIATDNFVGISENQPKTLNVLKNDFDPEGEPISLIDFAANTEASGTVERDDNKTPEDLTDDKLIYTPPADFSLNDTDSFTYTIADPNNQTVTATVNILAIPIFVKQDNNRNPFKGVDVGDDAAPTVGDLDEDGDEDVLIGKSWGGINYFRNEGGKFTEVTGSDNPFDEVDGFFGVNPTILDADSDGDEDVLVSNNDGNLLYFVNKKGSFTELKGSDNPFKEIKVGYNATPTAIDADSDGDEDLLVGNGDGNIKYFQNEKGSFTEVTGTDNPFLKVKVKFSSAPTVFDADSDGDEDLLVGNGDGNIKLFRNEGGSFTKALGSQNPFKGVEMGSDAKPTIFDADKDEDEDVLVGNGDGEIKYFENLTIDVTEVDILTGTPSSDTFTLGNNNNSFYANNGEQDYALIKKFNPDFDIIELHRTAAQYQLKASPIGLEEGTAIFLNSTELIGIVEGVSELNLKADYFSFI